MPRLANKNAFAVIMTGLLLLIGVVIVGRSLSAKNPIPRVASEITNDTGEKQSELTDRQPTSSEAINLEKTEIFSNNLVSPGDERAKLGGSEESARFPVRETRALWAWAGERAQSKQDIDELVAKVDDAHLNVVLLLVYSKGTAFFEPSHTRFPNADERLSNQSSFSVDKDGYSDALSYLLAIRNERRSDDNPFNDFEVHAWFNVTQGGDYIKHQDWPRPDNTQPYMLHFRYPEFKIKYGGYYLWGDDAYINHRFSVVHQPKFRAYMTDLIAGLVEDYDVDGVHLDYIRAVTVCYNNEPLDYPGTEYDYPGCQEDYKMWTQQTYRRAYTLWQDTDGDGVVQDGGSGRIAAWQERAVGMLVQSIRNEVKSVNPDAVISVAAVTNPVTPELRKASVQGQVVWEWLDRNWIDAAFVTIYSPDTQAVINRFQEIRDVAQQETSRSKMFPGLATHTVDAEIVEEWSSLIVEQVNALMYDQWAGQSLKPPAKGVALFDDRFLSKAAVRVLVAGPFKEPALPFWGETD